MFNKSVFLVPLIFSVAACGGGSGGSGGGSQPQATVLQTFADGSGVARAEQTVDGTTVTATIMAPDIQNYQPDDSPVAVDASQLTFDGSNAYGEFYSGQITINGTPVNVEFYQDFSGSVAIFYGATADGNALLALGEKVRNIPAGSYVYTGTNVIGLRDGSYGEDGTFSMNVNFDTGNGAISGSTATTTVGGSFAVNSSTGTFQGNNLTLNLDGNINSASIYGNFHGDGATGVTGIYHDNGSDPLVAGAIAGTR